AGGDEALAMIQAYQIRPERVLEVGCSNGWRLERLRERYGSRCFGVEPSAEAVADRRARFPRLRLPEGISALLPFDGFEPFDLLLYCFVLHWVDRRSLLSTIAEADRVLADGGYLVLCDFLPDFPQRNRYHHRNDTNVYTYKQDYASVFRST